MNTLTIVLLIILAISIILAVVLYFVGKKAQKKQEEYDEQIKSVSQVQSMLILDKKKMRLKDAPIPSFVIEKSPWIAKMSKAPIVKAKVGPKVMTLICDNKVFENLPLKKECKVEISGMYITGIKSVRGGMQPKEEKKSKSWFSKNK